MDGVDELQRQIQEMMTMMSEAVAKVNGTSRAAAWGAARIIQKEQQRLISQEFPQFAPAIQIMERDLAVPILSYTFEKIKYRIGYDTETLRAHPELLVIEFGRPGIIGAHSKKLMTGGAKTITVTAHGRNGEYTYKRHLKATALRYRNGRKVDIAPPMKPCQKTKP